MRTATNWRLLLIGQARPAAAIRSTCGPCSPRRVRWQEVRRVASCLPTAGPVLAHPVRAETGITAADLGALRAWAAEMG